MKQIKKLLCLCMILMLAFTMAGCKKETEESTDNEVKVEEQETPRVDEDMPANQNLLTGIADLSDEAIGKRPVAVMVNNIQDALPQYGIADADIIFEIVVEADQTRFMALYGDYTKVPKICSVRSCRKYFPAFSEGFDAVYVSWGRADDIVSYMESLNLTHYEGLTNTGGLYGRDQDRLDAGYALEHTGYFDGTQLPESMEELGYRTDLAEEKTGTAFLFNGLNEQLKPEGEDCTTANINFGAALATFKYDEATNTYLKEFNGNAQVDGKTGTQLAFTNVLVLEADISDDPNGIHRLIDWTEGDGYYVSNGAVQKMHWSKDSERDYLMLYDEDGEELSINRGKTYIAVNYIGQATFE